MSAERPADDRDPKRQRAGVLTAIGPINRVTAHEWLSLECVNCKHRMRAPRALRLSASVAVGSATAWESSPVFPTVRWRLRLRAHGVAKGPHEQSYVSVCPCRSLPRLLAVAQRAAFVISCVLFRPPNPCVEESEVESTYCFVILRRLGTRCGMVILQAALWWCCALLLSRARFGAAALRTRSTDGCALPWQELGPTVAEATICPPPDHAPNVHDEHRQLPLQDPGPAYFARGIHTQGNLLRMRRFQAKLARGEDVTDGVAVGSFSTGNSDDGARGACAPGSHCFWAFET